MLSVINTSCLISDENVFVNIITSLYIITSLITGICIAVHCMTYLIFLIFLYIAITIMIKATKVKITLIMLFCRKLLAFIKNTVIPGKSAPSS